jgi:hypothetical protein
MNTFFAINPSGGFSTGLAGYCMETQETIIYKDKQDE